LEEVALARFAFVAVNVSIKAVLALNNVEKNAVEVLLSENKLLE